MAGFVVLGSLAVATAAVPFTSATITRVENRVKLGDRRAAQTAARPAVVSDIVRASNFLFSESDSRAELQYPDGSLVRIGQNTVFSFDAESRTLSLDKGSLLFHIPKGSGGGVIKTPSLTAAITGTAGKVSPEIIAIIEGVVKLLPSGREVHAGEFARVNADGSISILPFDQAKINDGKLVDFNGHMPGFPETTLPIETPLPLNFVPDLRDLDVLSRTQNLPGSINIYFPPPPVDRSRPAVNVPPPNNTGNQPITNY